MEKQPKFEATSLEAGTKLLIEAYNEWSAGLGKYSIQAAYAIIAANWAVHRTTSSFLSNKASIWSIGPDLPL